MKDENWKKIWNYADEHLMINSNREQFYYDIRNTVLEQAEKGFDETSEKEHRDHYFKFLEDGFQDLTENTIIANIIRFEVFTFELIKYYLKRNRKLIIKKVAGAENFEAKEILPLFEKMIESDNIGEYLDEIIKIRLSKLKTPQSYLTYLETISNIKISEKYKSQYYELKATRDLIVHNNKVIDQKYFDKAQKLARGKIGETIQVNNLYLYQSFKLLGRIVMDILKKTVIEADKKTGR